MISKIDTIVYPYVIWSLLQGMVEVLLSRYTNNPSSLGDILSLFTHPRAQFWFLYALFMVFVLATLLYSKETYRYLLPVLIVISAGLYVYQDSLTKAFHFDYITRFLIFFLLGVFAIRYASLRFAHRQSGFRFAAGLPDRVYRVAVGIPRLFRPAVYRYRKFLPVTGD